MIDKEQLLQAVNNAIRDTDIFIVSLNVTADNDITVDLDSPEGIDLDTCAAISRTIEETFNRDDEDFSLEVGTAGLTAPFTVPGQYLKNIGNPVDVLTTDGRKIKGILSGYDAASGNATVSVTTKIKEPGSKRPIAKEVEECLTPQMIKEIKYRIDFK